MGDATEYRALQLVVVSPLESDTFFLAVPWSTADDEPTIATKVYTPLSIPDVYIPNQHYLFNISNHTLSLLLCFASRLAPSPLEHTEKYSIM